MFLHFTPCLDGPSLYVNMYVIFRMKARLMNTSCQTSLKMKRLMKTKHLMIPTMRNMVILEVRKLRLEPISPVKERMMMMTTTKA